jgi:glycosyltransferase involved in cell wall biosynthesis
MSNDTQPVSVIITTYNRSTLLPRAIHSALNACSEIDEVIVVDDGSTDDTPSVVKQFEGMIRYFRITNCGVASARNFGIRQSSNPLVAFLDDDDEWIPNKITLQRRLMAARSDVLFCFTNFYSQFSNGRTQKSCLFNWGQEVKDWARITGDMGTLYSEIAELPPSTEDFKVYIGNIYYHQMLDDYVLPSTMMVRRTETLDPACFEEGARLFESWAYSSLLSKLGKAAYLDIDTTCQHGHEGERLTDANQLIKLATKIRVLEQEWGRNSEFLYVYRKDYEQRIDRERRALIREMISNLKLRDARSELKKLHSQSLDSLSVLAHLPVTAVWLLLKARALMKSALK